MTSLEKWASIGASAVAVIAMGAHVIVRFSQLESANQERIKDILWLHDRTKGLEVRIREIEVEGRIRIRDHVTEVKADLAVLKSRLDALDAKPPE